MTDLEGLCPYPPDAPPLILDHYLKPPELAVAPEASNVACLDYRAAKGGPASRWAGETSLLADHFVRSDGESGKVI